MLYISSLLKIHEGHCYPQSIYNW